MERVMEKEQLVDEISKRCDFYKYNVRAMLDALDDIIVENMSMATKTEPSEIRLSIGFTFGGRYAPRRKVRDPRNGNEVMTPAKFIPYAKFSPSFRKKINRK